MKKKTNKKEVMAKLRVGDRVWLRIPHTGKIAFIFKNGDLRIELNAILPQTSMERFSEKEVLK